MKKKEILEIIKNKKTIENSILLPLYHDCNRCSDQKLFNKLIETYDDLKKQYQEDIKAKREYKEFQNSHVCNHQIRYLEFEDEPDGLVAEAFYQCIFCGHLIPRYKSQATWFQKRYYNNCIFIDEGYYKIFDFLIELLNSKDDNEEINFIEEFKNLNLDSCSFTINDYKNPEIYIMVISNTLENRKRISKNELIFLERLDKIKGIEILFFLSGNNKYYLSSDLLRSNNVFFQTNKLHLFDVEENLPLKMIINLNPNLIIRDETIYKKAITISEELKKMFPTSQIINLTELTSESIQEIITYIEQLINDSRQLDNDDNEYVKKLVR